MREKLSVTWLRVAPENHALVTERIAALEGELAAALSRLAKFEGRFCETFIVDRCPSCNGQTLFIGVGGWLTCSVIGCKAPATWDAWEAKLAATQAELARYDGCAAVLEPRLAELQQAERERTVAREERDAARAALGAEVAALKVAIDDVANELETMEDAERSGDIPSGSDLGNMARRLRKRAALTPQPAGAEEICDRCGLARGKVYGEACVRVVGSGDMVCGGAFVVLPPTEQADSRAVVEPAGPHIPPELARRALEALLEHALPLRSLAVVADLHKALGEKEQE